MSALGIQALGSPLFGPPHQYYGAVSVNGMPAQDDLLVSVMWEDKLVGVGKTNDGMYGYDTIFVVADTQGNLEGKELRFYVQDHDTGQTAIFSTSHSAVTNLDLSLTDVDFCGDNVCSSSESCASCPADCGVCPSTGTGSSGSASGTGGVWNKQSSKQLRGSNNK